MNTLDDNLKIDSCPHCSVDYPNMALEHTFSSSYDNKEEPKLWGVYTCKRCGGAILALANPKTKEVEEFFPSTETANDALPDKARDYLDQAMRTINSPSASIMVSNSAIDAMLKVKGYNNKDESLYTRIEAAGKNHLLTDDMVKWAHQVRLDSNDQRHADDNASLPTVNDAKRCLEFAKTLGEILFVLPEKVSRGISNCQTTPPQINKKQHKPRALDLPPAYRNAPYMHIIPLGKIDNMPVVTAIIRPVVGSGLLAPDLQPKELEVNNRPGFPNQWLATLRIENCKSYPNLSNVEIFVDGQVAQAGQLTVNLDLK